MMLVVLVVLAGLQLSLQSCSPGELTVTGGGVVREGQEVFFSLCLAQDKTCSERWDEDLLLSIVLLSIYLSVVTWKQTTTDGNKRKCEVKSNETIR